MNPSILPEFLPFINRQVTFQESVLEYHFKAEALLEVLLISNISDYSALTLHNYLWSISDLIEQSKVLSEDLLNRSLEIMALLESSTTPPKGGSGILH